MTRGKRVESSLKTEIVRKIRDEGLSVSVASSLAPVINWTQQFVRIEPQETGIPVSWGWPKKSVKI